MSVWLCIPSARPPAEAEPILAKWRKQGYKIALWRDAPGEEMQCDLAIVGGWIVGMDVNPRWPSVACCAYPGYGRAVNDLVAAVIGHCCDAEWFVTGGDDVEPDMNHTADEIAAQCSEHFRLNPTGETHLEIDGIAIKPPTYLRSDGTFGVMQPTGDRFDRGQIDRICGSPWMGREFCRRINQGRGPLWPEYRHMWVDEELQHVAIKYGVLWQRPDLTHLHHHFTREGAHLDSRAVSRMTPQGIRFGGANVPRPAHLEEANTNEHWKKYEALFKSRRDARPSFPGSEPL